MLSRLMRSKVIAILLILSMVIVPFCNINVNAETTNNKQVYVGDGFEVIFTVESQWAEAYHGTIAIKNTSDNTIDNWHLKFLLDANITDIQNAKILGKEDGQYLIKNAGWNQDIGAGATVSFGFTASINDKLEIPSSYSIPTDTFITDSKAYDVSFEYTNIWESGYTAKMTISNLSENAIEDWSLSFDYGNKITSIWEGVLKDNTDNHFVVNNNTYSQNIEPNGSVSFTFTGNTANTAYVPDNFILSYVGLSDNEKQEDADVSDTNASTKANINKDINADTSTEINKDTNTDANTEINTDTNADTNTEINTDTNTDMNVNNDVDTDSDGLLNWQEEYYKTAIDNPDTDGDGLNDYEEVSVLHTDPTLTDTDNNSILDGDEDFDSDGLSNLQEYKLSTSPIKADTDGDGLKDAEEVNTYNTSPILDDTDGDALRDGEEVALGLDLLNKYSDGKILDSERLIFQTLSKDNINESLLVEDNLLVPSLSGKVAGSMNNHLSIVDTSIDALNNNNAVIGKPIEIISDYSNNLKLTFDYSKLLKSYDISYINGLLICGYEDNQFVQYDTVISEKDNTLSTTIKKDGVYFVLNVNRFLDNIGVKTQSDVQKSNLNTSISTYSTSSNTRSTLKGLEKDVLSSMFATSSNITALANISAASTTDGVWVLLSDFQYVKLDDVVSATNNVDTDGDGLTDYQELGTPTTKNITSFALYLLKANGVPEDYYKGKTTISVYNYTSSPVLADTDFDGINDNKDLNPQNGTFSGTLVNTGLDISSNINYTMDYRTFFGNNNNYNNGLSVTSSIYSAVIYDGITYTDSASSTSYDIKELMEYQGFSDVAQYNLSSIYSDNHVSEVYIGHREVTYNGTTKDIVGVIVRGTNGTTKEWASNFDIGDTADFNLYADWTVKNNHKGFDITATRILKYIKNYIATNVDQTVDTAIWITGHSRGGAIANILGARLEDSGYDTFTYTYAAPNTTTASNASSYDSIFNVINSDDFVPCLPMTAWGFTKYGKTASISIADNYEEEWENLTGISDYDPDTIGMQDTIDAIADIAVNRDDCYNYTCKCHGDNSNDTITITNYGMSKKSREAAIAKIPKNALPYCIITRYNGGLFSGWNFDCCQTPAYFMQILAAVMAGDISYYRFVVELNIADRYEAAKTNIISSAIGGLAHPHYQDTYYLLATHIQASNFN